MSAYQRWYDADPTVSLAVSFIRNVSHDQQVIVARKIIEMANSFNVKLNETRILFNRRWYDEEEKIGIAMEYLKQCSKDERKKIALDVIDFLTEIKT